MKNRIIFCTLIVIIAISCRKKQDPVVTPVVTPIVTPVDPVDLTTEPVIQTTEFLTGYEIIWGMDFLPGGDLLFGEKKGKLYRKTAAGVIEITGLPVINTGGQGGLLDIRVHPNYATTGWIYCTYSGFHPGGGGSWNLMRFKLTDNKITNSQLLLTTTTPDNWQGHYGSRIDFDELGNLWVSVGEGGVTSYGGVNSPNQNAQNVQSVWGKIHRMKDDGSPALGNPILPGNTVATTVYSYGHRNPQGLVFNAVTKQMWESEHGPKGGDELNIIQAGANYGWPLVSFGVNYDNVVISANPLQSSITPPIHTWTPSIAPSGLAFITSNSFKKWKGNLLVGALAYRYLARCVIENNKVVSETKMFNNEGRVRNVKQGPDGAIYVSIESPGRIIRITAN